MDFLIILLLIFVGVLLLILEFSVIPGTTIAGIGGGLLLIGSIYLSFDSYGVIAGIITALFIVIIVPILFVKLFKGKAGKKMILSSEISAVVNEEETAGIQVGDNGITLGRLAPIGKVKVKDKVVEGKSLQGFLDENIPVEVVEITKIQIVVKPLNTIE